MFWQCHELAACETFPRGFPPQNLFGNEGVAPSVHNCSNPVTTWQGIVEVYSRCRLTFDKDKLIALAGVAQEISAIMGSEYKAGLFRTDLIPQLLWKINYCRQFNGLRSTRLESGGTPTWSWASIHGDLAFLRNIPAADLDTTMRLAEVLDISTEIATANVFGQVSGGILRLSALIYHMPVDETGEQKMIARLSLQIIGVDPRKCAVFPDLHAPSDPDALLLEQLYVPLLASMNPPNVVGLALTPINRQKGKPRGTYRRFGVFQSTEADVAACFTCIENRATWSELYEADDVASLVIV